MPHWRQNKRGWVFGGEEAANFTHCTHCHWPEHVQLVKGRRGVALAVDLQDGARHSTARDHLLVFGHRTLVRLLQMDVLQVHWKKQHRLLAGLCNHGNSSLKCKIVSIYTLTDWGMPICAPSCLSVFPALPLKYHQAPKLSNLLQHCMHVENE